MNELIHRIDGRPKFINGIGTVTRLGGSRLSPHGKEYMTRYSDRFFDLEWLEREVSQYAAEVFDVDAACVTSGAVAGLAIVAAGCMNRGEPSSVRRLPDTLGLASDVLMFKSHRILYDVGVRLSGAEVKEIGVTASVLPEDIRAAVSDQTAMFLYVDECKALRGSLPLAEVVRVLAGTGVPIVVDAAAEMPPFTRPAELLDTGADAVVVSGGKELRGPQASGLILGKAEVIQWCRRNNFPSYSIGRAMKFDRETLFGLLGALEDLFQRDEVAEHERWSNFADELITQLHHIAGIECERGYSNPPGIQPTNIPRVLIQSDRWTVEELQQRLLKTDRPVHSAIDGDRLVINVQALEREELTPLSKSIEQAVAEPTE